MRVKAAGRTFGPAWGMELPASPTHPQSRRWSALDRPKRPLPRRLTPTDSRRMHNADTGGAPPPHFTSPSA